MTVPAASSKVIVLISTQLRPGCDSAAYEALEARMEQLLNQIPGYLGAEGFTGEAGRTLGVIQFASHDALRHWRELPEHLEAQRLGREQFYARYEIRVCSVERAYDFDFERSPQRREQG
jgi:heme-degrading monooxygenase HmoA